MKTIYVDTLANGDNTGCCWENAYPIIQMALNDQNIDDIVLVRNMGVLGSTVIELEIKRIK